METKIKKNKSKNKHWKNKNGWWPFWAAVIEGRQGRLKISYPRWVFLWPFCCSFFHRIDLGPFLQLCQKIFEAPVLPAIIPTHQIGLDSFQLVQSAYHVSFYICEPSKRVQTLYIKAQLFIKVFKVPMMWKIICAYLKGLSKYRRMVFFFLKYLFSF